MSARARGARRQRGCLRERLERHRANRGEEPGRTPGLGGGRSWCRRRSACPSTISPTTTASPPCGPAARLGAWRRRLMNDWMCYLNRPQPQGVRCVAAQRRLLPGGRASRPRSLAGRPRLRRSRQRDGPPGRSPHI